MDGNSAALKRYQSQQDEAERVFNMHSPGVTEELVDAILDGEKIESGCSLFDLIENEQFAEYIARIVKADRDELCAIRDDLRLVCERSVRKWLQTEGGQAVVSDRCWEAQEEQ